MAIRITGAGVALTVGIIVLTGLIIGGLFWVKQSGEQARRDEAVRIAEENLEEQSGDDVALNSDQNNEKDKEKSEQSNGSNTETENSNDSSTSTNESQSGSEGATNSETDQSTDEMAQTGVSEEQTATELPQTGPAETGAVVALGMTTFAAVAYYRSRRSLLEAL